MKTVDQCDIIGKFIRSLCDIGFSHEIGIPESANEFSLHRIAFIVLLLTNKL
jgi:hypothetical protein